MKRLFAVAVCVLICCPAHADDNPSDLPWKVNKPIVTVQKERYFPYPDKRSPVWIDMHYIGPDLELWQMASSPYGDKLSRMEWRRSMDNGRTWSEFTPMVPSAPIAPVA